jgi:endonuclease/exonuclease/phosphatase family metal-dependent hydrolase
VQTNARSLPPAKAGGWSVRAAVNVGKQRENVPPCGRPAMAASGRMRTNQKRLLLCLLAAIALGAIAGWPAGAGHSDTIVIATWNLEWLVTPETAHAGRLACRNGQRSALPCDVAQDLSRDSADIARLAAYARELDADIVAFQEVENEAIARKVFTGYRICMADGAGVQHVGFAVRAHLLHRCGPALESLSMNGRSRKAMSMQLTPARGAPIEMLVVHLKSGCASDPLDSQLAACRMLAQQAGLLGDWIAMQSGRAASFIVLGDFNRASPESGDDAFWQQVQTGPVELVATELPFRNCFAGQPWTRFIDHLLVSAPLLPRLVRGSPRHLGYRSADVVRYRLSDHCPVSISLNMAELT